MDKISIRDQAAYVYDLCSGIAVSANGDRWDVFDGPDGPYVETVDTAVLVELNDSYDLPVRLVDGSYWNAPGAGMS